MERTFTFILLSCLLMSGCGVKGAPMPRRDEVFIEKTLIQNEEEAADKKKSKDKMTIMPAKDPR